MLTMCERRWSRDIHHHVTCRGGEEEGFGLLVLLNCYVSDLSKEVASHWRHVGNMTQGHGPWTPGGGEQARACGVGCVVGEI